MDPHDDRTVDTAPTDALAESVLTLARNLLPGRLDWPLDDPVAARLDHARLHVRAELRDVPDEPTRLAVLSALDDQLRMVRGRLDAAPARATDVPATEVRGTGVRAAAELDGVLARLRSIRSASELFERAPVELASLGFTRTLISRIDSGTWVTERAFVRDDPDLAGSLVEAGRAHPRRLDRELLETEMVRRRRPMLVADPRRSRRTHRELVHLVDTRAYVAAPVLVHGTAVGIVHADRHADTGLVAAPDRWLVGAFAESLGQALEVVIAADRLRELSSDVGLRLRELRSELADRLHEIDQLVDSIPAPDLGLPFERAERVRDGTFPAHDATPAVVLALSTRERDVFREMAAGKTNAQVGSALFISETTVKYHVGNVLRKLGVANRAEAVARYYRTRPNGGPTPT